MAGSQQDAGSNRGGSGKTADKAQRGSEAGPKGGEHSHGTQARGQQPPTTQRGNGESGGYSDGRAKTPDIVEEGATG